MSQEDGINVFLDMFFHIVFLLTGLAMALPTLLPIGTDVVAYIFSIAFVEFFTIMVGVLIVAKMVMWMALTVVFKVPKMNVWVYYIVESTFVTVWILFVMTTIFNAEIITSTIANFVVLVALVFITGLLGPVVRLVVRGK